MNLEFKPWIKRGFRSALYASLLVLLSNIFLYGLIQAGLLSSTLSEQGGLRDLGKFFNLLINAAGVAYTTIRSLPDTCLGGVQLAVIRTQYSQNALSLFFVFLHWFLTIYLASWLHDAKKITRRPVAIFLCYVLGISLMLIIYFESAALINGVRVPCGIIPV